MGKNPFRDIMLSTKNKIPVSLGIKLSYYDAATQEIICRLLCEEKLRPLNYKTADYLREECLAPSATENEIKEALSKLDTPPKSATISVKFTKSRFIPYLEKTGSPEAFENLLLELLEARFGVLQ